MTPISFSALIYLLVNAISTLTSLNPKISAQNLLVLMSYVTVFLIWTMNICKSDTRRYFQAICGAGVITSIYALWQHTGKDVLNIIWDHPELVVSRSIGTFGNPTFLAGYLVMVLPIIAYMLLEGKTVIPVRYLKFSFAVSISSILYFSIGITCLLAMVFTYTRGSWAAGILSLIFLLFAGGRHLWLQYRKKILILLFLTILFLTTFIMVQSLSGSKLTLVSRVLSLRNLNDLFLDRVFLWRIGLLNFRENFFFGSGPGTFPYAFPRYRFAEPPENRGRIAVPEACHNEFIEVASSTGIFGLLSFVATIVVAFYVGLKHVKSSVNGDKTKWLCILSSCVAYLAHNFFLYPTISTEILWWFLLSMLASESGKSYTAQKQRERLMWFQSLFIFLVVLASLYLMIINIEIVWGNRQIKLAKEYELEGKWEESFTAYTIAVACDPGNYKYHLYKGKMLEGLFRLNPGGEPLRAEILRSYHTANALNPLDPYCLADMGRFYGFLAGRINKDFFDEAETSYLAAIALDPYNPLFYNDLANLYAHLQKDDLALQNYEKGLVLHPRSVTLHFNLALFYLEKQDRVKSMAHINEVLKIDPGNTKARDLLKRLEREETEERRQKIEDRGQKTENRR